MIQWSSDFLAIQLSNYFTSSQFSLYGEFLRNKILHSRREIRKITVARSDCFFLGNDRCHRERLPTTMYRPGCLRRRGAVRSGRIERENFPSHPLFHSSVLRAPSGTLQPLSFIPDAFEFTPSRPPEGSTPLSLSVFFLSRRIDVSSRSDSHYTSESRWSMFRERIRKSADVSSRKDSFESYRDIGFLLSRRIIDCRGSSLQWISRDRVVTLCPVTRYYFLLYSRKYK